jgi:hypothetical protein
VAPTATPIVSESQAPDRVPHSVFVALAVMSAGVLSILHPEAIPHDAEELYNASHARLIQLGHWDRWLDLQYRGHCGGCTQNALIGAGLFKVFGESLAVWKMVPVLFNGLLAYAGASLIHRSSGLFGAVAFGALLIFAPPTFLELSLTAWGNHFEAGVGAVVILSAAHWLMFRPSWARSIVLGVLLALVLWTGFSSAFIALGLGVALIGRIPKTYAIVAAVLGASVGLLWWYQSLNAPSGPFETIYYARETLPSVARIPSKLWTLIAPRQLVALFGLPTVTGGWALGWASAATICTAGWIGRDNPAMKMALTMLGAFVLVYSTVRFTVWAPPAPQIAPPGSMRYAAPIYGLSFVILALGAGTLWSQTKRVHALLLLIPALTVGSVARSSHFSVPFPDKSVFSMSASDFQYSRDQLSYLLTADEHRSCPHTEPDVVAFHAFGMGWNNARESLDLDPLATFDVTSAPLAELEGMAAAILSELDGDETAGIRVLAAVDERLPKASETTRFEVLAAASWRRPWLDGLPEHGSLRIAEFSRKTGHHTPIIQAALAHSLGRGWAHDTIQWRQPRPLQLPDLDGLGDPLARRFISGFAEGVGERWGPGSHQISGLKATHQPSWDSGLTRGTGRRWLSQSR